MHGILGTSVCLLAALLVVSQSAPLRDARDVTSKWKCLTRSEASGWKKCDEPTTASDSAVLTYDDLHFETKLEQNAFPEIEVPEK